jgi:hypothetical protein
VSFDDAGAEEELGADLGVRPSVMGKPCDLLLLRRDLVARVISALAHGLARGRQLASGAIGASLATHRGEHGVRVAQLLARLHPTVLAPQPFAVAQPAAVEAITPVLEALVAAVYASFAAMSPSTLSRPASRSTDQGTGQALHGREEPPTARLCRQRSNRWTSTSAWPARDDHTFVRDELDNIAADALLPARIGAEEDLPPREVGG